MLYLHFKKFTNENYTSHCIYNNRQVYFIPCPGSADLYLVSIFIDTLAGPVRKIGLKKQRRTLINFFIIMSKVKLCRSITGATILVIPHPSYRIISHTRAADHYSRSGDVILPKYAQFYDKNGKIYRRTFTVGRPPYVRSGYLTGSFRKLWP